MATAQEKIAPGLRSVDNGSTPAPDPVAVAGPGAPPVAPTSGSRGAAPRSARSLFQGAGVPLPIQPPERSLHDSEGWRGGRGELAIWPLRQAVAPRPPAPA